MQELENYRKEIDNIDKEIINLLSKRFEVVKKVGELKKQHNLAPLQPQRWQEVLNSRKSTGESLGVNPDFIENIWNEIHDEALRLEE